MMSQLRFIGTFDSFIVTKKRINMTASRRQGSSGYATYPSLTRILPDDKAGKKKMKCIELLSFLNQALEIQ